jgi:glycerol kinase
MPDFIAALDQGTTSTRCIIFNRSGEILTSSQKEHEQIYPKAGWVEHNPKEIWDNTREVIASALAKSDLRPSDLAGIGITNQRETTLVWSRKTGQAVGNAIVWQDTRSDEICSRLAQNGGQDRFREQTGLPLSTYFSGPKLIWILENNQEALELANAGELLFGTIDSWLIWNLTGGTKTGIHMTDVTNASRTMLMNLSTLDWDQEILSEMGIPSSILPRISSSSEIYGHAVGSLEGLPVAGVLGDQQAALFGQTCFQPGDAKNTYGTGCFLLMNSGGKPTISDQGLLTTLAYQLGDDSPVYALEGSIAIAGALVQWLRDNLGLIQTSEEIEELASQVQDNGGMYIVPAFSGLFAPYWKTNARGVMVGLTRYINKNHIARAALESTAYQTRDILEAMEKDSGVELNALKVDGGMVVNDLLMQFQADILNVPVIRPVVTETTALGAAYAAGLAVGMWDTLDDLKSNWQQDKRWQPTMDDSERHQLFHSWGKAVQRSFDWTES